MLNKNPSQLLTFDTIFTQFPAELNTVFTVHKKGFYYEAAGVKNQGRFVPSQLRIKLIPVYNSITHKILEHTQTFPPLHTLTPLYIK